MGEFPKIIKPKILAVRDAEIVGFETRAYDSDGNEIPFQGAGSAPTPTPSPPPSGSPRHFKGNIAIWDLGSASGPGERDPNLNDGVMNNELIVTTLASGKRKCDLAIDIVSGPSTDPGEASGGYQFYLHESFKEYEPPNPEVAMTTRAGVGGVLWSGGDHLPIGVKWTFREFRKPDVYPNPRAKLVVSVIAEAGKSDEWSQKHPHVLQIGTAWNICFSTWWTI